MDGFMRKTYSDTSLWYQQMDYKELKHKGNVSTTKSNRG